MDRILLFAFSHQVVIIEIIFAIILGIVVVWLFSHLHPESDESINSRDGQIEDMKEALKRVLESTDLRMTTTAQAVHNIRDEDDEKGPTTMAGFGPSGQAAAAPKGPASSSSPGASGAPGVSGAPGAPTPSAASGDPAEVSNLRRENEVKMQKMAELEKALAQAKEELQKAKSNPSASGPGGPSPDELLLKIKNLESRLAEYEIIEDDIANLSLYKEENIKLKAEIDRLKRGGGTPPASESPTPAFSNPAPAEAAAESVPAVEPVPTVTSPSANPEMASETIVAEANPPPPASSPTDGEIDSEKLLQEFDALVSAEKNAEEQKPVAVESKPADEKKAGESSNDLIQEFEKFVKGGHG